MPDLIKKFLFSFLSFLIVFASVVPGLKSVSAAEPSSTWYNQSPFEWYLKVYDESVSDPSEIFGERYTAAQVQWVYWATGSWLLNTVVLGHTEVWVCMLSPDLGSCFPDVLSAFESIKNLFGGEGSTVRTPVSTLASTVGASPISGVAYFKNLVLKFNPVREVHAQGFGFSTGANSVVALWRVSRNIAFALLILAAIAMSFMIMFRVKISPQVVISVQSAIPKIISAMLLITFSYALAGLAIDLMYIVIGLLASFISGSGLSSHSTLELFDSFTTGENAIGLLFEFWMAFVITSLASIVSSFNPATWGGGIILFVFAVVTIVVMIVFTFKIIALVFKNFVNVILTIVTGPLEILMGTVVQGAGFGPWFRKLISYLAVYPVIALLFFLAFFFLAQSLNVGLVGAAANLIGADFAKVFPFNPKLDVISGNTWDPPLSTWLVTGDALLWAIVAYVIITLIPKTAEIVQGLVSGKPFAYGTAIGEAMVPVQWMNKNFVAPITGSFQQAAGRERLMAIQSRITSAIEARRSEGKRFPQWLENVLTAHPGNE